MADEPEFQPDWRLDVPDAMAVVMRIQLHRRGIVPDGLETDGDWRVLCEDIVRGMEASRISPVKFVEMPRAWDSSPGEAKT